MNAWAAGEPPPDGLAIYTFGSKIDKYIGAYVFCHNSIVICSCKFNDNCIVCHSEIPSIEKVAER